MVFLTAVMGATAPAYIRPVPRVPPPAQHAAHASPCGRQLQSDYLGTTEGGSPLAWISPASRQRCRSARRLAGGAAALRASTTGAGAAADVEADVCILGAGIIGLCTALTLLRADPSMRVVLLDRQEPCAGATGAGQGYLWLAHRDVGSPLFRLAAASVGMWRELLAPMVPELSREAVEWQEVGSMLLASTPEEAEALARRQALLAAEGLQGARLLSAAEALRLEPALRLSSHGAALLLPTDLQVSGRAAAAALLRACQACGPRFTALFGEEATRLGAGPSGRVEAVHTAARRVHATRGVVVALGAWSGAFLADQLADARWAAAFRPRRGLLLEMPRPHDMPAVRHGLMEVGYTQHYARGSTDTTTSRGGSSGSTADVAAPSTDGRISAAATAEAAAAGAAGGEGEEGVDITFTATTSASGTLLVGSSREFAGFDRGAPEEVVAAIMERAAAFLPGLGAVQRHDISVRSGPRPYATYGAPTVAPVPGMEGLIVAAGHEGSGLTLAPATATLVAGYLLERPSGLDGAVVEALRSPFGMDIDNYLSM